MFDDLDVTCTGLPTAEQGLADARRRREKVALWVWNDDWHENQLIAAALIAEMKAEWASHPRIEN
jgi:hypothetical protein